MDSSNVLYCESWDVIKRHSINSVNQVCPKRGEGISIALPFRSLDSRLRGLV